MSRVLQNSVLNICKYEYFSGEEDPFLPLGPQDDLRHNKGKNYYFRLKKNEDFRPVKVPVKIAFFNAFNPMKDKLANNHQKLLFPYESNFLFFFSFGLTL